MKTKAILVIDDMPDICYKCPCYDHEGGICQASNSWKTDRENGCPLRPLNKIVKAGDRNLIIYERKWLYEHLEEEFELQKKVRDFDESHISN